MATKTLTSNQEIVDALFAGEISTADAIYHPINGRLLFGEEITDRIFVFQSTAAAYFVDTGEGLVALDIGRRADRDALYEAVREWRPDTPLVAVVMSHHHLDHIFCTDRFEEEAEARGWPKPVVYAHEALVADFDRYKLTAGYQTAINRRQLPGGDIFEVKDGDSFPTDFRYPDVTFKDRLVFKRGDLTFDMRFSLGETDDQIWTWIPELNAIHASDQYIWAVPNCGNPQKVQRYAREWAEVLRKMAAMHPEILLAGHGYPIIGHDRIQEALEAPAKLLESLEEQTLALMNEGKSLDEVLRTVVIPQDLLQLPYLRPVYDDPQFIVRAIWRRWGGWWDREYDSLLPAPRAEQGREWVALAGGKDAVAKRIEELTAAGELRLASHLMETLVHAEPTEDVFALRARHWKARADQETSTIVRNIMLHAAQASEVGEMDIAGKAG